jgi:KaiC/GvpD/RAD55 family RecA-like ATPase
MARQFVKSGIPGLDAPLAGGFLRDSIITVSGPTGCGKSTFGMNFLVAGAKAKEPGLYISIEESKQAAYDHFSGYKWDLEKLEKSKMLIFLDYPIHEVEQFLSSTAIQEIVSTFGIKRVVVDSIMPVALHFKEEDERKRGLLKFIENVRKWGVTVMFISEDTPASTQDVLPSTRYGIESFTDGWIHIYYLFSAKGRERTRAVEILKMKGIAHSSKIYPCEITDDGFAVHSD